MRGVLAIGAFAAMLCGCSQAPSADPARAPQVSAKGPFKGIVLRQPAGDGRILICHQPIPDLGPAAGESYAELAGEPMGMPFWADLDVTRLHAGDAVEFQLRVDWSNGKPVLVTSLRTVEKQDPGFACAQ